MSADPDTTRIVRSWLRKDEHESADRLVDNVLALLDATPQRRSWPARRFANTNSNMKLAITVAAVVTVVVAVGLGSRADVRVAGPSVRPPSVGSSPSPSSARSPVEADYGPLALGQHEISWPGGPADARVRVTIAADHWAWMGPARSTIYKDHGFLFGFPADLETHTVAQVVTSVCALDGATGEVGPIFTDVGPTVDDLVSALAAVGGTSWSEPMDILIGGYPGKRLMTTDQGICPGPTRRTIWEDPTGSFFVEDGTRSTVDILDVDGDRLVITRHLRTTDPAIVQELDAIVSSMAILRGQRLVDHPVLPDNASGRLFPRAVGPDADLRTGRHRAVVEGIPFSFAVRESGWETQGGFYLSKSITGPQGAEGTIRWTTIPNGEYTEACPQVLSDRPGRSTRDVAEAVATGPGITLLEGPNDVTVGGRPAMSVTLQVERDLGCDPAYFYTYEPIDGGAMWLATKAGDVISVWIVDVDGKILFIEAEATESAQPILEGSFRSIVDSMRFE